MGSTSRTLLFILALFISAAHANIFDRFKDFVGSAITSIWDDEVDPHTYHSRIWEYKSNTPKFPETSAIGVVTGASVGVAFSGGGSRSLSATAGQLLGLEELGLLDNIQYASSTSGGAWAASIFGWAEEDKPTLLGAYVAPKNLKTADLDSVPDKSIKKVATKISRTSLGLNALKDIFKGVDSKQLYNQAIQANVLSPFDLGGTSETNPPFFSFWKPYANKNVFQYNKDNLLTSEYNAYQHKSGPFVIINMGVLPDPDKPYQVVGMECSPISIGVPQLHEKVASVAGSEAKYDLGGGWFEPFAFNSARYHNGTLKVTVIRGTDLEAENSFGGDPDVYVEIKWSGESTKTTIKTGRTVEFNEDLTLTTSGISYNGDIVVSVRDEDTGIDDNLGKVTLLTRDLVVGTKVSKTLNLDGNGGKGTLEIALTLESFQLVTTTDERIQSDSQSTQFSLRDCVGTGSGDLALEANAGSDLGGELIVPEYTMPPAQNLAEPRNLPVTFRYVDGGEVENTAIMPLLLRQVQNIIVFINTNDPVLKADDDEIVVSSQLAALFGYQPKELIDPKANDNKYDPWTTYTGQSLIKDTYEIFSHNQVFDSADFDSIRTELFEDVQNGRPVYAVRKGISIRTNTYWGIKPYTANVIFFYNSLNKEWESELSQEAKDVLGNTDKVKNFPHFDTSSQLQLTPEEANLMVNMQVYTVSVNAKADVEALFPSAASSDTPPDEYPSDYDAFLDAAPGNTVPSSGSDNGSTKTSCNFTLVLLACSFLFSVIVTL